jgi:hypothetical protein
MEVKWKRCFRIKRNANSLPLQPPSSDISWPCPNTKSATAAVLQTLAPNCTDTTMKRTQSCLYQQKKVLYCSVIKQRAFSVWKCWGHWVFTKWVAKLCWLVTSLCAKFGLFTAADTENKETNTKQSYIQENYIRRKIVSCVLRLYY